MWWRTVGIALVVAAVAATAGCGGGDGDTEAQLARGPDGGGSFEWVSVDLDLQLERAVALGDGFVGQTIEVKPGYDETTELPFLVTVVTSPDGQTWTEADIPVLEPDELVQWHSGGPAGAVASVMSPPMEGRVPDVLFTPDGIEWLRGSLPDDAFDPDAESFGPETYAVGQAGVMAAAMSHGPQGSQSVVLLSQDLQEWQTVQHPLPTSRETGLEVAASPQGQYLLTSGVGGAEGPVPIVGYVSPDGQSWEPVTSTEEYQIVGGGNDWSTGWREGFAVVADIPADDTTGSDDGMGRPQIWLTTQDGTWSEADMDALPGGMIPGLRGSSLGLLAINEVWPEEGAETNAGDTHLVFTSDGRKWEAISSHDTFGSGHPMPVVLGETTLLVGVYPETETEPTGIQLWLGTPTQP